MCTTGKEDLGGRTDLGCQARLETALGKSSRSLGRKEEQSVGKMFTGLGRAGGSKDISGTVVGCLI